MAGSYSSPKGVRDILEPDSGRLRRLVDLFARRTALAGYGEIKLPIFEEVGVFARVGESTDIVQKQMYNFLDKDDRQMVLRPESTAGVMRAYIQHRPTTPWKVWYEGAHFRYEKPQAGRYRQFYQVGAEVLGTDDPKADVEIIALGLDFLHDAEVEVKLLLNSLGSVKTRQNYIVALEKYFEGRAGELSGESKNTLKLNPLRVLDSKRTQDEKVILEAPLMSDFLDDEDKEHFEEVTKGLEALGISFQLAPRLVRGLDYYTRTAFEYVSEDLDFAQNALGGGGRYDGLSEDLGGPTCPGVGFALGMDRILLAANQRSQDPNQQEKSATPDTPVSVFIADVAGGSTAPLIASGLREMGISAKWAFDNRSLKAQMKLADKSGAEFAVIVGEDELAAESVSLVNLRKPKGDEKDSEKETKSRTGQELIPQKEILTEIQKRLKK